MGESLVFGASDAPAGSASRSGAAGLALLAAVTPDGVPENTALGVSLGEGTGGLALLAAIFVSNFPEALVGSASMQEQGRSRRHILGVWTICAVLLTVAVAAGAVLASLADTPMPEAYEQGGPTVALSTTAGFVLSFVLSTPLRSQGTGAPATRRTSPRRTAARRGARRLQEPPDARDPDPAALLAACSWEGIHVRPGQVCEGSDGSWKLRNRDEATDGYCVEGRYYSEDSASWRQTSPRSQECNGVWKETVMSPIPYRSGARLYRNTNYTNLPLP